MLTETTIKAVRPQERPYKLTDERGLMLLVNPNGSRWWRLRFRYQGREQMLSLGVYPDVSLKRAREKRDEARSLLADGVNPAAKRTAERAAGADTFEAVGREWFAKQEPNWAPSHSVKILARLEQDLFPWLGSRPVGSIKAAELLTTLRRIESRGALDTAHRAHQNSGQIFRYAVATGRAERDPSGDLRGALAPAKPSHYPTITDPEKIGVLLRAIDGYTGSQLVRNALKLAPLVFVRPGELRAAEWAEFDLKKQEWRIRAERMKARVQHIVPLSRQAIAVLEELQPLTGDTRYLFPSIRTWIKPMSENTVNAALRGLGFSRNELTAHGFRSMASTLLNEQGWHRDAIERQLAHGERDQVRAAYNYAEHLPERRKMMQSWADYLDGLRASVHARHSE
ncbi:MAG: integrase arm-type DNA-binding domain-containing protein [Pseudomonadota bacterium]